MSEPRPGLVAQSPLVAAVAARLADRIRSGTFQPGQGLPSERKLANDLGVSRGVVRAAIQQLAFGGLISIRPNCRPVVVLYERTPTPLSRTTIGIWLWPNTGDYATTAILRGIQGANLGENVRLVIGNLQGQEWDAVYDSEARFLRSMAEGPDGVGVIIWYLGAEKNLSELQLLRASGVPIVFVDRRSPAGFEADYVGTNNESAAMRGVDHLISLGHRRIAMLSNVDSSSSVLDREAGYRQALLRASIPVREDYAQRITEDEPKGVERLVDSLLSLEQPPTAIFCINDNMALLVHEALERRGLAVPDDISVLGFDGLLRWVPGGGHLTSLYQDFERIGKVATELVFERISSHTPAAYKHLFFDAPLVDCGSTAPPPQCREPDDSALVSGCI
jgi:DNA-binding LacI/PurR family transcriptional regulator